MKDQIKSIPLVIEDLKTTRFRFRPFTSCQIIDEQIYSFSQEEPKSFIMGKHYCDYCDRFLKSASAQGRKQHNRGKKHQENVRAYYAQYLGARRPSYGPIRNHPMRVQPPGPARFMRGPPPPRRPFPPRNSCPTLSISLHLG